MKDGPDGWGWSFELDPVELGKDEDGEPVTTCVVRLTSEPAILKTSGGRKAKPGRKPDNRKLLEFEASFNNAMMDCAKDHYVGGDPAALVRAVRVEYVRERFKTRWAVDVTDPKARSTKISNDFRGILKALPPGFYTTGADEHGVELIWRIPQ